MKNQLTENKINLLGKNKILLLMGHKKNRKILKEILESSYEVIITDVNKIPGDIFDAIIFDEQALVKHKDTFFDNQREEKSLINLPMAFITSNSLENIGTQFLDKIDEIITTPASKKLIKYRIDNLIQNNNKSLHLSSEIYESLSRSSTIGFCVLKENTIKYINSAFLEIIEEEKNNIIDKNVLEVFNSSKIKEHLSQNNTTQKISFTFKLQNVKKDKWVDISNDKVKFLDTTFDLLIIVNITDHISFRDELTDLYNRGFLEKEIKRLNTNRQLPISMIMADLNGLKLINESYGYKKGDEILIKTAHLLKKCLRTEDIVARWGGDEFVILLPNTNKKEAQKIYERIKNKCQESENDDFPISLGLGIGIKTEPEEDFEEIFNQAQEKMGQNKLMEGKSAKNLMVKSLLNTLGAKSFETQEHAMRMTALSQKLGEKIGVTNFQLERLSLLAQLHDIGKTAISEEILTKPGELTQKEWETIKTHPERGFKIAASTPEFASVAEEIMAHHEHWDGTGYPNGLKGEEIPYLARIISIIDSYDVMRHDRPYSEAISKEKALKEIKDCGGSHFDPELAEKFVEMMK
ncbi:MAG: HD domain-containing phosphohydrolase [bacterium]